MTGTGAKSEHVTTDTLKTDPSKTDQIKTGPFTRLLIAERGAAAVRIIKSARAMGLTCVAVYSRADQDSPHVSLAQEAVLLPEEALQSIDALIEAARSSGAQAVHPGMGALAESAALAQACLAADLIFVGPAPEVLALVGDKAQVRRALGAANVLCVPGEDAEDQTAEALAAAAERIGYPVMIKPAFGVAGQGMRLAEGAYAFDTALAAVQEAALTAFGAGEVVLERALDEPRALEVQVLADAEGGLLHLGTRDCSIQRHHQVVLAEAPAPGLTAPQREALVTMAFAAARAVGLVGVGTVEVLIEPDAEPYCAEVTPRLSAGFQATEAVTGLDLVQEQLRIAQGLPLGRTQDEILSDGHAMTVRLMAEDPAAGYQPQAGRLVLWQAADDAVVEAGVETGQAIAPRPEPLLATLTAQGRSREESRQRLRRAVQKTLALGVANTRDLLMQILDQDAFRLGRINTGFLGEHLPCPGAAPLSPQEIAVAAALFYWRQSEAATKAAPALPAELLSWSNQGALRRQLRLRATQGGLDRALIGRDGALTLRLEDHSGNLWVFIGDTLAVLSRDARGQVRLDGALVALDAAVFAGAQLYLATEARSYALMLEPPRRPLRAPRAQGDLLAPLNGRVRGVFRRTGDLVQEGEVLMTIEAMKLSHQLRATCTGRIVALPVVAGDQVSRGDLLVRIEATEGALEGALEGAADWL
ncbi:biotin carboxylase N-terminal domain-containing protein [Arenibacterium sp. LLYu02]|uniref:ATP-binding protein n=1 Tax=Arenibacterium sp. LLYu02 TaxID=3404132 RepID=UPI003B215966